MRKADIRALRDAALLPYDSFWRWPAAPLSGPSRAGSTFAFTVRRSSASRRAVSWSLPVCAYNPGLSTPPAAVP